MNHSFPALLLLPRRAERCAQGGAQGEVVDFVNFGKKLHSASSSIEGLSFVGVKMAPPLGVDMNSALNQARDEAYASAACGTDGSL